MATALYPLNYPPETLEIKTIRKSPVIILAQNITRVTETLQMAMVAERDLELAQYKFKTFLFKVKHIDC